MSAEVAEGLNRGMKAFSRMCLRSKKIVYVLTSYISLKIFKPCFVRSNYFCVEILNTK